VAGPDADAADEAEGDPDRNVADGVPDAAGELVDEYDTNVDVAAGVPDGELVPVADTAPVVEGDGEDEDEGETDPGELEGDDDAPAVIVAEKDTKGGVGKADVDAADDAEAAGDDEAAADAVAAGVDVDVAVGHGPLAKYDTDGALR
jgi:hypothetical protein